MMMISNVETVIIAAVVVYVRNLIISNNEYNNT